MNTISLINLQLVDYIFVLLKKIISLSKCYVLNHLLFLVKFHSALFISTFVSYISIKNFEEIEKINLLKFIDNEKNYL